MLVVRATYTNWPSERRSRAKTTRQTAFVGACPLLIVLLISLLIGCCEAPWDLTCARPVSKEGEARLAAWVSNAEACGPLPPARLPALAFRRLQGRERH